MKRIIEKVTEEIKQCYDTPQVFNMLLKAYNRVQEDECDSVDYLFNLDNKDDLICCIQGGLTIKEIINIHDGIGTNYFFFGYNHEKVRGLLHIELLAQIYNFIDTIVHFMFAYPQVKEYHDLYNYFVTSKIINYAE